MSDNFLSYLSNLPADRIKDYHSIVEYGKEMFDQIYLQTAEQYTVINTVRSFAVGWFHFYPGQSLMTGYWGSEKAARFAVNQAKSIFSNGNHLHNYIELGYVYRGDFTEIIKDRSRHFREGEFFLIDSNCIHRDDYTDNESIVFFLCMKKAFFDEVFLRGLGNSNLQRFVRNIILSKKNEASYLRFRIEDRSEAEAYLWTIMQEMQEKKSGFSYIIKGIMNRLLNLLTENYMAKMQRNDRQINNEIHAKLIMDHIEANYRTVTIAALSETFFYGRNFYNRIVQQETGLSFTEYVQFLRLKSAEQLLSESCLPISDIIHLVGYNNTGYFYKIFQEAYGMSPSDYREHSVLAASIENISDKTSTE
ncbi:MAG: AraC family transcriptional regulator [Lachnospiraceae bacterium]|nr:AraC family transcriptional regulator [Lachnospiraceae bacterium]